MDYSYEDIAKMIDHSLLVMRGLGATRIGASRTIDILEECKRRLGAAG